MRDRSAKGSNEYYNHENSFQATAVICFVSQIVPNVREVKAIALIPG
jgi:hypothetical protein